jgi:hypothetical protein
MRHRDASVQPRRPELNGKWTLTLWLAPGIFKVSGEKLNLFSGMASATSRICFFDSPDLAVHSEANDLLELKRQGEVGS